MPDVLTGLRILDLTTGPVGGVATAVLADFGADVVKVEPPGGDRFRALAGAPLWLRGKRSAVIDLMTEAGRAALAPLVESADVLVVSGPPERAARFGVDADLALAANPALVHVAITGFGPRGPYAALPAYEGIVAAKAGRMAVFARQVRREGPGFAAVSVASHACAMGAVQGVAAALLARERTGRGQRVETSLLQALLPYDLVSLLLVQLAEREGARPPDPLAIGGDMPTLNYHPVLAKDGRWIQCGNLLEHLFLSFLDAIDLLGELLSEPRFAGSPATWDAEAIESARDRILLRIRERTADEWMQRFHANGDVAAEPYRTPREALDHPDLVANGSVITLDDPVLGPVRQVGPIARLVATPARPARGAPRVGEHTAEVLGEKRTLATRTATGRELPPGRPLAGITVLELATIIAAPLATTLLADLGARVIKVEALEGDPYRHLLTRGVMAVKTNAGKESICLDLKSTAGREIARDLVRRADVLVHNFRPGVPERLGIDYESARALRPDLIWVSANGYGPDGPSARRPATHPVAGAAMGGAGHQGAPALARPHETFAEIREGARQLMRANEANPDPNTSVVIAAAIALALFARERTGIGQPIYVDMLTANAWANADGFLDYAGKPERARVDAELLGFGPTYRLYPAREGWVFLALTSDAEWGRFCAAAQPRLAADAAFASAALRTANAKELTVALAAVFRSRDADAWEALAAEARFACVRADASEPGRFFAADPHVAVNGFVQRSAHARFGEVLRWGPLVTVGGAAERYGAGALAGDCTDAILRELGRDVAEIARLREHRVAASEPIFSGNASESALSLT